MENYGEIIRSWTATRLALHCPIRPSHLMSNLHYVTAMNATFRIAYLMKFANVQSVWALVIKSKIQCKSYALKKNSVIPR